MEYLKNRNYLLKHIVVIPIVSTLIIPLAVLDLWAEIYHRICFPLYRMPYVKRSRYIKIDRHKLQYLSFWQKCYCVYCGYGNGLLHYWREIAAQTEKYWCGIRHKESSSFKEPEHHNAMNFPKYGNEEGFKQRYKQ